MIENNKYYNNADKHFFMNGGILKIAAQDDAISASADNACIVIIRGGKLLIN